VVVKDEHSRRLIVKLPSSHHVTNFTLRVERSEQPSKLNYTVYVLRQNSKQRIGAGRIQEHQWAQVSREMYKLE
jgi:hypothetical protein